MIKQLWEKLSARVDAMTLRERAMIFAAAAFLLVSLVNTFLLDPILLKQKNLSQEVVQQHEKMKEVQAQIEAIIQAKNSQNTSPQRLELNKIRQEMDEGSAYLNSNRENLVEPDKMAELLRQVLSRNANLQLVNLQTLPVTSLFDQEEGKSALANLVSATPLPEKQIFKHGVELTVRGNYLDLLHYLSSLERLPTQMFWGKVKMEVVSYPVAELTLTLYTLSLEKIWLQI
jgi:MSHA biogenesis protein MshJ